MQIKITETVFFIIFCNTLNLSAHIWTHVQLTFFLFIQFNYNLLLSPGSPSTMQTFRCNFVGGNCLSCRGSWECLWDLFSLEWIWQTWQVPLFSFFVPNFVEIASECRRFVPRRQVGKQALCLWEKVLVFSQSVSHSQVCSGSGWQSLKDYRFPFPISPSTSLTIFSSFSTLPPPPPVSLLLDCYALP